MLTLSATRDFIAMGVHCRIEIVSPQVPALLDSCVSLVDDLEKLWSRFRPASDISRLNNAGSATVHVDPRTTQLIAAMQQAHLATRGTFNPTQLPVQLRAGDTSSLALPGHTTLDSKSRTWESLSDIQFHSPVEVSLPQGMTLDAGGIGKGLAADMVSTHALHHGAHAVSVNLGGDIRVAQKDNMTHDYPIDVLNPVSATGVLTTISLRDGAIATSTRNARWRDGTGVANHIMGATNDVIGASVIASTGIWADVWAKHLVLSPTGLADIEQHGLAGLLVRHDGTVESTPSWKDFEQC